MLRGVLLLAVLAGVCQAQQRPCDPQLPLGPSHDLYCIDLIPAPGARGVSGSVELVLPDAPFTVSVTADGRSRFTPVIRLAGLDDTRTYIARAMTVQLDSVIELGPVKNGSTTLAPIELEKFTIVVSERETGRFVLRGQSPGTRLFPPDLLEFSMATSGGEAHEHTGGWPMVPTPPGLTMLPAEMALRPPPGVTPLLPVDSNAPAARPRETVRLNNGDTLRLEAGTVRRTIRGRTYTMYAYNGQYPGPLIEVRQGAEIYIQLINRLPDASSIHWHGIRLDNPFDGVSAVAREFTYRLRFPDAGIYWYHPHLREDIQQDLGLYGNILVRGPGDLYGPAHREAVLMLDDLLVGDDGLIPFGKETPTHALTGRFGNVLLVNGEPRYQLSVRRGEVVRFYLTNASSTRTFNVSFPGARMKVVAADAGPFEREVWVESVVIAPAERYVVHVRFEKPGDAALLNQVRGLDHLFGRFFPQIDTLGLIHVESRPVSRDLSESFDVRRRLPPPLADIARHRDGPPDRTLVLTVATRDLPFVTDRLMQRDSIYFAPVEWGGTMPMMNWASSGNQVRWILRDPETGRENMDAAWHFARGAPVKIRLVNERRAFHGMQHPIHLHGQRFLVLAVNGVPNDDLAWKDTVLVPAGAVVDILLDTSNPGDWMLHCHIAEHLSAGMMMHFTVD